MEEDDDNAKRSVALVFVYGTLKRGFGNHWLKEEMLAGGHAEFMGPALTTERFPLVCGPYQVPFLLWMEGHGHRVAGELYAVDGHALARLDHLEGTAHGHYVRRPLLVRRLDHDADQGGCEIEAEAYFGGESYAGRLWRKAGHRCLGTYSQEESRNYVRRKDRPPHMTFLQHIDAFVSDEHRCETRSPLNPITATVAAGDC